MPARTKARKRALDLLYESEIRGIDVLDLLDQRTAEASPPVSGYGAELVRGVQAHRARIDELLSAYSQGWTLERMPAVDRNILRIAVYELFWAPDVPDAVAISEAVVAARDLSTDGSPSFVNGLLARLLELKPELEETTTEPDQPSGEAAPPPPGAPAQPPSARRPGSARPSAPAQPPGEADLAE